MKWSFISPFYPFRGGIAQFSDEVEKACTNKLEFHRINFKRQYPDFLFPGKTQYVEEYKKKQVVDPTHLLDSINLFSACKVARRIKKEKPDVVIFSYWMSFFVPIYLFVEFLLGKKYKKIALVHNLIPHENKFYDKFLIKQFVKYQDGFITLSTAVKQDILKVSPNARVKSLFHPIYANYSPKIPRTIASEILNIPKDSKVILFFGLIREYKGLESLIYAFSKLSEEYHLLIVGEPYQSFESYDLIISKLGISERVTKVLKFVPNEDVNLYFSIADICVLPYKTATQSGVTSVSVFFETPVVATNVGGLSESIEHGVDGVLCEPNSVDALVEGIEYVFMDSNYKRLKDNLVIRNKNKSWSVFVDEMCSFIETI